jgi:hypothetical protein
MRLFRGGDTVAARLKRRTLRRLAWTGCGGVVCLVVVASIESYTANRKFDEFLRRTGQIREGMTEAEVRASAGQPDRFVTDLGSAIDPLTTAASCPETNGSAAMLYTFVYAGWIGERLGAISGMTTEVVCLNDRRIVVDTYSQIVHF